MDPQPIVTIRHWSEFHQAGQVLAACLADLGGLERFIRPGQTVVVKPNITASGPASSGGTTHVELVEALVHQVWRCAPSRIVVAEGTFTFGTTQEAGFPVGGWREMAARTGVELYNLDAGPHTELTLPGARYPHPLPFSQFIVDADVYISVPCLKTHINCDYTVALKNGYGLIPGWKRSEIHRQYLLEQALVDLNRIRKPDLVIVDGWEGAEGIAGGSSFTSPAGARLLLAGDDPVAVDVVSRQIMGLPGRTRYLDWAIENGVGVGDPARIQVTGLQVADCCRPFRWPAHELMELMPGLVVHDLGACSGCRSAALTAAYRFAHQKLLKPLTVVFGKEGEPPPCSADTIVAGDCAAHLGHLGMHIAGCPAGVPEIVAAMERLGCICQRCHDVAHQALAGFAPASLPHLRVAAAGSEVFVGAEVKRTEWHQELLVGDCMERYAAAVLERSPQLGMVPGKDVVWLRGCPVEEAEVRAVLQRLSES